MKIQTFISSLLQTNMRALSYRYLLLSIAAVMTLSTSGMIVFAEKAAAQSTPAFCNKFDGGKREACADGYNGGTCEFWLTTDDEAHRDACEAGANNKNTQGEQPTTPTNPTNPTNPTTPTNPGTTTPNPETPSTPVDPGKNTSNSDGGGDDQLQKQIDLLKEINKLANGDVNADEAKDNTYGQYVNGAGKLQSINVRKATDGKLSPAIIFFNGGGWITNDGMGGKVAPKANERGYTTFEATYRLGSSGVYYQLEDVLRAVKHVRNNSAMYGIDPNRIAIWGDSAGGSLTMRAAGTGQSGAAVAVGWSAPTNAYTALFHSAQSFAIGMVHSTCAPTDITGAIDTINQINGGEAGDPKELYDGGIGNFGTSGDALSDVISVLEIAQQAQATGKSTEEISGQIESEGSAGEAGGADQGENVRRLASKKVIECIDNFNSMSPALFASALSPPSFLAGYEGDPLVHPGQAYQMRDKLRTLGIQSEALILPGQKHLGFEEEMVQPSLDFVDKFLNPSK